MRMLAYRTLPADQWLPVDQRWRIIELDETQEFTGLDLSAPQGVTAAIRRVNDGKVPHVDPIPAGSTVFLVDTDLAEVESWDLSLQISQSEG